MIRQSAGNLPIPATFEQLESRIFLDNNPPVVDDQAFSVDENSAAGTVVGTVLATDPDAGDGLTYSITDGNTGTAFAIDAATGEITVAGAIDYETLDNFVLTVLVTDDGTPSLSDTAAVTVAVNDVNDAPVVNDQAFNLNENSPLGTVVGTVLASDRDAGQTLAYILTDGNTGNAFAIDHVTGQITVAGTLDHEMTDTFAITLRVTDNGTPSQTSTATVTIAVNDVNEAPLVNDQAFTVNENSAAGTVVGTVQAYDVDPGQTLTYVITSGNTNNAFAINSATGQITVAGTLDYETLNNFVLTVLVTDNGTPSLSDTAQVTIGVNDVNDPPLINDQYFRVDEHAGAGTVVGTVLASDPDAGQTLAYAITGGNTGDTFAINPATGEITVVVPLDHETQNLYALTVEVTDDATPSLSDTATVTIGFNDAPVVDDQAFSVDENSAGGTVVGTVVASDPNPGQTLTYAITGGNTGNAFAIDSATGQITVAGALDYETLDNFVLTVLVTDDGTPSLSDTAAVTIAVNDANDAPVVNDQAFNLNENSPIGTVVGTVLASDPDAGQTLTYAITGGNTDDAFAIDPTTGEITVAGPLDPETQNLYVLTVEVADNGTPSLSAFATVIIGFNHAPVINDQAFSVDENLPWGTAVGTVQASDPDAGQTLTYTMTGGNTNSTFAIDPFTGQITVASMLDYETQSLYVLTVQVTDDGTPSLSATATVTIAVNDVNDAPVVNNQAFSVDENSAGGTVVGTVVASDGDPGQTLVYAITAGNTGDTFAIDPATGLITLVGTLNHETQDSFILTVEVADDGTPSLGSFATVMIYVIDINEAPVVSDHAFSVDENSAVGTIVGTVLASDVDVGQTLTYIITGGNTGNAFALNSATGRITVAGPLDHETRDTYVLTVRVTDNATPALSATATVTISVNNVNEMPVEVANLDHLAGGTSEQFGYVVAISGNLVLVGDPREDTASGGQDAGAIRVFQRTGTTWTQVAYLTAADAAAFDLFGSSAAIDGLKAIVGAPGNDLPAADGGGAAYVFQRVLGVWKQTACLTAPGVSPGAAFGSSVSISGGWAIVGAPWDMTPGGADDGSAYLFRQSGSAWTQVARLTPPDTPTGDAFGFAVSIKGNLAVIGAPLGGAGNGAVYVYKRLLTGWSLMAEILAPAGAETFGSSVATDGTVVVVGAPSGAGAAYLFTLSGGTWTQAAQWTIADADADGHFGRTVAIDGDLVVIGATNTLTQAGSAYVFKRQGAAWPGVARLVAPGAADDGQFGWAVAVDGSYIVVGADTDDTATADNAGAAYVFKQAPTLGAFAINDPVQRGDKIVLVANNVQSSNEGKTAAVRFYRDLNGDGVLDAGDILLGTGVKQTGTTNYRLAVPTMGTAVKTPYPLGENRFLVEITDSNGAKTVVPGSVTIANRPPTIASLTTNAKSYKQGATVTLTAKRVADLDGTVTKVEFYMDADGDGALDLPGDTKIGEQPVGKYGAYTVTYPLAGDAVTAPTRFFAVATDNGDARSIAATATVPVIPTVSIEATDYQAAETVLGEAANLATFTIRRSGTRGNLTVKLAASGTARFGPTGDYTLSVGATNLPALSVVIPNGADNVVVTINPVDNIQLEPTETVILTLLTNAAYVLDPAPANRTATANVLDNDATAKFTLTSSAFANGQPMPSLYTAHGGNVSPPIAWSDVPATTKQFVLIVEDTDRASAVHWLVYKIPTSATSIAQGTVPAGAVQGINWLGGSKYDGPDRLSGPAHHYRFRLYALNTELALGAGLSKAVLTRAMTGHIVAMAELVGTYQT